MATKTKSKTVTVLYKRAKDLRFDVTDSKGNPVSLTINGANARIRNTDGSVIQNAALPFGDNAYGITLNVDAELWEKVKAEYGSMNIFKMGIIRASEPTDVKEAEKEIKKVKKTDDPIKPVDEEKK
jgi:hypothetical protein